MVKKIQKLERKTRKRTPNSLQQRNVSKYVQFKLFQILITIPVSTVSNECTFSNSKRIKTYLRNMTEMRIYFFIFLLI